MPRKQFLEDLQEAQQSHGFPDIVDIIPGDETGQFSFLYTSPLQPSVSISALIPEVSEYPNSHSFMIFAGEQAPPEIAAALQELRNIDGKSISQLLDIVSRTLLPTRPDSDGDIEMLDSQFEEESEEEEDQEGDFGFGDEDDWGLGSGPAPAATFATAQQLATSRDSRALSKLRSRARLDLRAVKDAGFKVAVHGHILEGGSCFVSVSCRVIKLGVSDEAMQAWQLNKHDYLIFLLHYPQGYIPLDDLMTCSAYEVRERFEMRVGKSTNYKPSYLESIKVFSTVSHGESQRFDGASGEETTNGFQNIFISKPLNQLLNERLLRLIGYRYQGMMWDDAEAFYGDPKDILFTSLLTRSDMKGNTVASSLSELLMHDHILEKVDGHSLPLLGMQFLLRHVVRCTEFCLVCHCRLKEDLEAIKPYVCDKPLCLYQYMSLGFGPSIEHELIAQPYVVDLLVSFCYERASTQRLRDFPLGLSLSVPSYFPKTAAYSAPQPPYSVTPVSRESLGPNSIPMRFARDSLEMIFEKGTVCPVRKGEWIVIESRVSEELLHCRIVDTALFPVIKVSVPITRAVRMSPEASAMHSSMQTFASGIKGEKSTPVKTSAFMAASFVKYDRNFDGLSDAERWSSICLMLDMLPKVSEMREQLIKKYPAELKDWVNRIPPAALGMLRWIIASNRACIVQVDTLNTGTNESSIPVTKMVEDRVHGMGDWMQFRFAMGAPDKEKRFRNAVRSTTDRLELKYPTLFAWHGSPLHNWHSIIREGLHFRDTVHGRAFGHGCYHSLDHNVSLGYAGVYGTQNTTASRNCWPRSELQISFALCLNEIVNAPQEFVSRSPHLVVSQLDWIQTRYMFVKCHGDLKVVENSKGLQAHEQDPKMTPAGPLGKIVIPAAAVSTVSRSQRVLAKYNGKKAKGKGTVKDPVLVDGADEDDLASVWTEEEDLEIFWDEDEAVADTRNRKPDGIMDFKPGQLGRESLPLLAEPDYATLSATKRLQQDLRALLKVQDSTPIYELGWYIDANLFDDNLYQWIVELHSFDEALPVAQDMKKKGLESIVLELRFPRNYPISPPFVRVIRPRFLPFLNGGGGHVTAGGALCMELLTTTGWSPVNSLESVLIQVKMAISSTEPRPARLLNGGVRDYGEGEAMEAYVRACLTHGWQIPEGFRELKSK